MTIYRGFTIKAHADGTFAIYLGKAPVAGSYPSEDAALDAIDALIKSKPA